MTRSVQHTPAPPRAESGSAGKETAATATVAQPQPEAESTGAKPGAEGEETAAEVAEATPAAGAATEGRTTESEAESDPGAAAAAKSRLPALVRTMTATAIGRPRQQAGPVGRPGRAVLAGAAVAGALLVSVPFLVLAGNDDKGPGQPAMAAGTVLDGSAPEAPGEFAVTPPESGSLDDGEKKDTDESKPVKPVKQVPVPDAPKQAADPEDAPKKAADPEDAPKRQSDRKESGGTENQPAKAASGVTFSAPVSLRSHLSGRCIEVPAHDFRDGKALHVWDCDNSVAQQWRFASDGTVRIKDKCLDVANANLSNGTPIQIAWCNGNAAQQFVLNPSHDLVNTGVGMCIDIADSNRGSGASLQLWSCAGSDNQKWST